MAELSDADAAREEAVRTYWDALGAPLAPLDALELAVDSAFEDGRIAGAGDMERIERHARADELEAWAAATLRRANEVRANVGLEPPELDSDWHGDAYDRLIERSQNVVNFRRHDSWIWLAVTGGPAVAVMSADETADLAANLWAAAKAAREPNQIRQGDPE